MKYEYMRRIKLERSGKGRVGFRIDNRLYLSPYPILVLLRGGLKTFMNNSEVWATIEI